MSKLLLSLCAWLPALVVLAIGDEPAPEKLTDLDGRRYFKTALTDNQAKALQRMEEPSLWTRSPEDSSIHLRWTWLRTWAEPVSIRVSKAPGKAALIIVKMLDGKGGYDHGHIRLKRTIELNDSEWDKLLTWTAKPDFWTPLTLEEQYQTSVLDGSSWDFEFSKPDRYEIIALSSPRSAKIPEGRYFEAHVTLARLLLRYSKLEIQDADFH